MSNWQPIETAPKDGTEVLVTDGAAIWIAVYRRPTPVELERQKLGGARAYFWYDATSEAPLDPVTHWMPAPALPDQA